MVQLCQEEKGRHWWNTWPDSAAATDSVTEEHVPGEGVPGHISKC